MMTIEEAVYTKTIGDATLAGLVGTRVYPLLVPQDAAMPAIAYQKVSSFKHQAHDGSSHLARSRIQFTVEADDYATAKSVATALKECWDSYAGYVGDTVNGLAIQGTSIENDIDGENIGATAQMATPVMMAPVVRIDVVMWHYE